MTRSAKAEAVLVARPSSPSPRLTYEEFLDWDGENQHAEWVDGEVIPMPPISNDHQDVSLFLLGLMKDFVELLGLGVIRYEPFQMKTGPALPGRSPDIMFIAKRNLARIKKNHLEGPADIVVEVISPGSRAVDRGDKHYEYERGGVKEYWLIDSEREQGEFYVLGRDRVYRAADIPEGVFHSTVLKRFWLKTDWLWERPLPPTIPILRELGVL